MAADEMLCDDYVEVGGRTVAVPDSFGVDHGDGSLQADPQAVGLGPLDAPATFEAELFEPRF